MEEFKFKTPWNMIPTWFKIVWATTLLAGMALLAGGIYVAYHFLAKVW